MSVSYECDDEVFSIFNVLIFIIKYVCKTLIKNLLFSNIEYVTCLGLPFPVYQKLTATSILALREYFSKILAKSVTNLGSPYILPK